MQLKTIMTYQFHFSKTQIETIKVCVDKNGKTSSWLFVPEISNLENQWVKMDNNQFRKEFNMYVKNLKDIYQIKNKDDTDFDSDDQLSLEI